MKRAGFIAYQIIAWALVALCALMIHCLSGQDADQSGALSAEVTDVVARIVSPQLAGQRDDPAFIRLHGLVRKGAHMAEYCLLALLIMAALAPWRLRLRFKLPVLPACAAYAALDEWHQSFVSGRAAGAGDVLIDTLGACVGFAIALAARSFALWLARGLEAGRRDR